MSDDLLRPESPKVIAQLVIQLVEAPGGNVITVASQGDFNEMNGRYMMDKTRSTLDDHWRMANAPKVAPVNGLAHIPESIKRRFRG